MTAELVQILQQHGSSIASPWSGSDPGALATITFDRLSINDGLMKSDAHLLELRWFVEGFIPSGFTNDRPAAVGVLYKHCLTRVQEQFPLYGANQQRELARQLREIALELLMRETVARRSIPKSTRDQLLDLAGGTPRCYLCGSAFDALAIELFLGETKIAIPADHVIDFMYPKGIVSQDHTIVVDHVRPVADGGVTDIQNMRLACGFCNSIKSDALTLYGSSRRVRDFVHPALGAGRVVPPNPLWVLRLLALVGKCAECGVSSEEAGLRVTPFPVDPLPRYSNPSNLRVICETHDPIRTLRFVDRKLLSHRVKR